MFVIILVIGLGNRDFVILDFAPLLSLAAPCQDLFCSECEGEAIC